MLCCGAVARCASCIRRTPSHCFTTHSHTTWYAATTPRLQIRIELWILQYNFSKEQSICWLRNWSDSTKMHGATIRFIVHYHVYRCLPHVPILSQINLVHALPFHFLKIHFNIILPSMSGSSNWPLSLGFPHQNPVCDSPLPHTCYMSHPYHSSWFDHLNSIWWEVQIIKILIMKFTPLPSYTVPPRPKYSPQHPILKHPQPKFLPQCERQFHTHTKQQTKL